MTQKRRATAFMKLVKSAEGALQNLFDRMRAIRLLSMMVIKRLSYKLFTS